VRRLTTLATAPEEERAATALVCWAAREAELRGQAATDWPTHLQYAGSGLLAVLMDGEEVVWPRQDDAGGAP
jgi:hypothetical protein